jgi:hypothetical protein
VREFHSHSIGITHDQLPAAIGLASEDFDGFGVHGNSLPGIILACAFKITIREGVFDSASVNYHASIMMSVP